MVPTTIVPTKVPYLNSVICLSSSSSFILHPSSSSSWHRQAQLFEREADASLFKKKLRFLLKTALKSKDIPWQPFTTASYTCMSRRRIPDIWSFKMYLTGRSPAKKIMPASYMYVMYYVGISCMTFTNVSNGKKVYLIPFTFCHQRLWTPITQFSVSHQLRRA